MTLCPSAVHMITGWNQSFYRHWKKPSTSLGVHGGTRTNQDMVGWGGAGRGGAGQGRAGQGRAGVFWPFRVVMELSSAGWVWEIDDFQDCSRTGTSAPPSYLEIKVSLGDSTTNSKAGVSLGWVRTGGLGVAK